MHKDGKSRLLHGWSHFTNGPHARMSALLWAPTMQPSSVSVRATSTTRCSTRLQFCPPSGQPTEARFSHARRTPGVVLGSGAAPPNEAPPASPVPASSTATTGGGAGFGAGAGPGLHCAATSRLAIKVSAARFDRIVFTPPPFGLTTRSNLPVG
jgi:hypothetical protein